MTEVASSFSRLMIVASTRLLTSPILRFSIIPEKITAYPFKPLKKFERQAPTTENRPLKLVKRGFRDRTEPLSCGVAFESNPAWIWSLRLSDWEEIYITDVDELRLRQYHHSTWVHTKDRLKIVASIQDATRSESVKVWFLSGSRSFLEELELPEDIPRVLWAEGCGRRRPPDTKATHWFSVSHETVGGSTTARGVFGQQVHADNLKKKVSQP